MLWTVICCALAHPLPEGSATQPHATDAPARPESEVLRHPVQLTSRDMFVKAGEAYFSPDESWIIFQAVPVPTEGEPDAFYSMYVGRLVREEGRVVGLDDIEMISEPGSANTCGWFPPEIPGKVLFGSTVAPPEDQDRSGFQVGTRKYVWQFPPETEIVTRFIPKIFMSTPGETKFDRTTFVLPDDATTSKRLFERPEYDAEGSWSKDGRYVLYAHVNERESTEAADADIWIYDTRSDTHLPIVQAKGYDGGPFFSPD
ncbi:MAG: PD40 domain-containing protein, partial [Phycisphaerales bacterium]|nr:PD40 domain-containing protein [Phycisphaerales bacterium]